MRVGGAAVTLSGRVWRGILTALRLPMELLSLASFKAQQVRRPANVAFPRADASRRSSAPLCRNALP